ncbi:unnamed protein product, partial [Ixodes hexagonus]
VFECPECSKTFASEIGLGVHRQGKHKAAYNAGISVERVKARWTAEESFLLAKMEVDLSRQGVKNINQALHYNLQRLERNKGGARTFESIKSHRRMKAYRVILAHSLADPDGSELEATEASGAPACRRSPESGGRQQRSGDEQDNPAMPEAVVPRLGGSPTTSRKKLAAELRSLTQRQAPTTHGAADLWAIAKNAIYGADVTMPFNNYLRQNFFWDTPERTNHRHRRQRTTRRPLSRRKRKKQEYAAVQDMFKKRQSDCIREILNGKTEANVSDPQAFLQEWESIMAGPTLP